MILTKPMVENAIDRNEWNLGNDILYDMCEKHPSHKLKEEVLAKIWLIGRAYAVAIERRKEYKELIGDAFYERVWEKIKEKDVDGWLNDLKEIDTVSTENLGMLLSRHKKLTDLFHAISGLEKRSLASKYLHFHFRKLFFIYDDRAVRAVSKLSDITGRIGRSTFEESDNEYRKFYEKCLRIQGYVKREFNIELSPRKLDNLLLQIEETR